MSEGELLQVIERAAKEDLQSPDLRNNQLSSLPPEIVKLTASVRARYRPFIGTADNGPAPARRPAVII